MTLNQFLFEGGAHGANLSNATSGSVASSVGTGTATFDSGMAAHGALGARFNSGGSGNATFRRWPLATATTQFQFSGVLTHSGAQPSTVEVGGFVNAAGQRRLSVQAPLDGGLALRTTSATYVMATAAQVAAGEKVRLTCEVVGGSTTAGVITAHLYKQSAPGKWDQPVGTAVSVTDANLSVDQIVGFDAGCLTGISAAYTVGWDDLQLRDGTGAEIPDYTVPNDPPTVDAGSNQSVMSGATVNLSGTASDPDGTIASLAWTFVAAASTGTPTLSGASTLTPSFTAGAAPQLYTLQLAATDNLGVTVTDTVEIRVPVSGATDARPLPFAAANTGAWTRTGGTSDGGALADESNTTYLESAPVSGTEQTIRTRLQPSGARATGRVQVTLGMDTGTGTWQVRLFEGNTLRQSWSQAGVPATPTAYEFELSAGTLAAITDWGNLFLELGVTS